MLGEQLDSKVQNHVQALRNAGMPTGSSVVMAAGEGMIMAHDRTLLVQHGGHIEITKSWARSKEFKEEVEDVFWIALLDQNKQLALQLLIHIPLRIEPLRIKNITCNIP